MYKSTSRKKMTTAQEYDMNLRTVTLLYHGLTFIKIIFILMFRTKFELFACTDVKTLFSNNMEFGWGRHKPIEENFWYFFPLPK